MTIADMQKRLDELNKRACEIQATADTDGNRDLTDVEARDLQQTLDDFEALEIQKKQRARLEAQTERLRQHPDNGGADPDGQVSNRQTAPPTPGRRPADPPVAGDRVHERWLDDPNLGWRSQGEFLQAVHGASAHGATPDARLTRAALATFGNEAVGADGGFAVPPAFLDRIMEEVDGESVLMSLVDSMTVERNSMTIPVDETTPWGTAGVQGNWVGEGNVIPQSKPSLRTITLKLHKLASLVPLTEELLEDATALESYMMRRVGMVFGHLVDLAFYQGSGSGRPLGMLNGPGTISVAKESGQAADTVEALNVINMWTRLFASWRANSIWLVNQDVEPQLMQMYLTDLESTKLSSWPVYLPQGGLSAQPFSTLFGRPVIFTQIAETLGDKGDIMVIDPKQYLKIEKAGGMKSTTSMHFWFDQDALAFKTTLRIAGQPWWQSTIAARDGTTTYAAFVTLDERA